MTAIQRREFMQMLFAGGLTASAFGRIGLARVPGSSRFVFVLLRGGLDGLAAVVPIDDPDYAEVRGNMAFQRDGLMPLSDGFALAPGLESMIAFWERDELAVLHAMAIPYRTRSHFDGQAILETGLDRPDGSADGWLNRLLQVMEGEGSGVAVAAGLPRSLSGSHPVTTWSPANLGAVDDGYVDRLHLLYQQDPVLLNAFEASLQMQSMTEGMEPGPRMGPGGRGGRVAPILSAAARFLREPEGPNVAAVEFGGWDTHANQGTAGGQLDQLLRGLATGLATFREEMGDRWAETTVVVMTEFGRTARPNGTRGTDHGTAGVGFLLGPSVSKRAVVADWPGLGERDLFEERDLRPTLDTRAVLKGTIAGALDLTRSQVERVFPGSEDSPPRFDLLM